MKKVCVALTCLLLCIGFVSAQKVCASKPPFKQFEYGKHRYDINKQLKQGNVLIAKEKGPYLFYESVYFGKECVVMLLFDENDNLRSTMIVWVNQDINLEVYNQYFLDYGVPIKRYEHLKSYAWKRDKQQDFVILRTNESTRVIFQRDGVF